MVTPPYVIGLDIGTGSTKGVAFSTQGNVLATAQAYYVTDSPQPGFAEQDPAAIWQAFVECLQSILGTVQYAPAGVSFSSCMHSLVAVDAKGAPFTPLITWADTRSEAVAQKLRQQNGAEAIYTSTGTPLHSMSPLCKIIWMKEQQEEVFQKVFKFLSIKEYIWYRLFGQYEVDYSIASATGLFNIHSLQWHPPSLELCGIKEEQLSRIVPTTYLRKEVLPEIAALLQIPADVPFCIGASDGCLANIGSGAVTNGVAAVTIGTSGAVRIASTEPITNFRAMLFNYRLDESHFICGGPVNNGGNVLQWVAQSFGGVAAPEDADYEELMEQIGKVPAGAKALLFLPYLLGERAPVWDEKSSGVYVGIKPYHTTPFFMRAALEGVCFALLNVLEEVERTSSPIQQLNVSGGFIHSSIWMQLLADVTGKKLCLLSTEDASATGAAILCFKSLHLQANYALPGNVQPVIIEPNAANHARYQQLYTVYKSLYANLSRAMQSLHDINH